MREIRVQMAACALVAGMFVLVATVAGATARADEPPPVLRLTAVSLTSRTVSLETSVVPGAKAVALARDGVETARVFLPEGPGAVARFDGVPAPGDTSAFRAHYLDARGETITESATFTVNAADLVPVAPRFKISKNAVVAPGSIVRGSCGAFTTGATLIIGATEVSCAPTTSTTGDLAVVLPQLPYGRTGLVIRATNAWGSALSTPLSVWNLGATPARPDYILVSLRECRLYRIERGVLTARYSVSVGRPRTPTPTGEFVMTRKGKSSRKQRAGMGAYWMRLEKTTSKGLKFSGYFIHGTSWAAAIGRSYSLGCVDMLDSQILKFGPTVSNGTHVLIRP